MSMSQYAKYDRQVMETTRGPDGEFHSTLLSLNGLYLNIRGLPRLYSGLCFMSPPGAIVEHVEDGRVGFVRNGKLMQPGDSFHGVQFEQSDDFFATAFRSLDKGSSFSADSVMDMAGTLYKIREHRIAGPWYENLSQLMWAVGHFFPPEIGKSVHSAELTDITFVGPSDGRTGDGRHLVTVARWQTNRRLLALNYKDWVNSTAIVEKPRPEIVELFPGETFHNL